MEKELVLLRGLPSSGKSFRAMELAGCNGDIICSADNYFGATPQEYVANWSAEKLGQAHWQCGQCVLHLMKSEAPLIVVDNTNTLVREMVKYAELAQEYGYSIRLEEPTSPWWKEQIAPFLVDKEKNRDHLEDMCRFLAEKSQETHRVPLESIRNMMFRFDVAVTPERLKSAALANLAAENDKLSHAEKPGAEK